MLRSFSPRLHRTYQFFITVALSSLHLIEGSRLSMASGGLGVSNVRVSVLSFNKARVGYSLNLNEQRPWIRPKPLKYASLATSHQSGKDIRASSVPSVETAAAKDLVKDSEETKSPCLTDRLIPNSSEVESLVTEICDSTSIAEFELKLDGFRLYVARNIADKSSPPPPSTPAPVTATATTEGLDTNGSVSSHSLAITKPASSSSGSSLAEKAADEGLVMLQSPKVGFFRRSRTIKGKHAPPSCKEKQIVKEGQVLCYVEQLGGQIPIESDVSGEVVKILREDGDPVGYNDALIAILPSFPGIKKIQ